MSQQSKFRNEEPLTREISATKNDQNGKSDPHPSENGHSAKDDSKSAIQNHDGEKAKPTNKGPQGTDKPENKGPEGTDKKEERFGLFTGKKQEGVPSLFGHLPKPDFKEIFSKPEVGQPATVSENKAAPDQDHKKDEGKKTDEKTHAEQEKSRVNEKQPDPAPLNLFGKPVGDLFKQPSQPLFSAAPSKPEGQKETEKQEEKKAADASAAPKPEKTLFGNLGSASVSSLFGTQSTPIQGLFGNNPPAASLFSNQATQQTGLFGNAAAGTASIFGSKPPTTGLFSQGSSLFSSQSNGTQSQPPFNFAKPSERDNASDEEGGEENEEEADKKSEENYNPKDDGQAYVYTSPYEQVYTSQFEDLKIDKKDGIGIGIISIEKLKPKEPEKDAKDESKQEQPQGVRLEFPLLVVKTKAKVILGTYKMIPKRSNSAFLKANNSCVSVTVFQIQKGEGAEAAKLVTFNVKVKFTEEKIAEEFKKEFDKLVY